MRWVSRLRIISRLRVCDANPVSYSGWDYMLGWASDFAFAWGVEGDVLDRARKIARD